MATISSPGLGSGLDVGNLVSRLVAAEGQPASNRLDRREAGFQAKISALGSLKGALSGFQSKLATLSTLGTFQGRKVTTTSSGTTDAFTATATSSAAAANYNINVTQLAQAQTLVSDTANPYTSINDVVGTGTLTVRFGTGPIGSFAQNTNKGTFTVTIDSTNNTLEGVRDAINKADIGVRASIINNGSGYLLSLTSEDSGATNSLEISVSDTGDGNDTDNLGLSRLAYNATAAQLSEGVAAQDATVVIDGITVTNSNNTIADAIEGVTLNLTGVLSGTLGVALDKDLASTTVDDFVSSYNSLISTVNKLTLYDPDTGIAGVLNGDVGTRSILTQVRRTINTIVPNLSGPFSTLAELGITTQSDGTLKTDSSKLKDALDNNFDDIAGLFAVLGQPNDSLIKYTSASDATLNGNYSVTVDALATQGAISGASTASLADDGSGNFTSAFVVDANNDTFVIKVDGVSSGTISLTQQSYATTSALAAEIQTRINADTALLSNNVAVSVIFDAANDRFDIVSNRYGSASTVSFDSVDTNTSVGLGFDIALTGVDGTDVQGSIDGATATGSGRFLTAIGDATGLKIEVTGGATGSRGSVNFTRGIADQINTYITSLLDDDIIDDRIKSAQSNISDIQDDRTALTRRLESLETRLMARFSALDLLVSQLQTTSNFLSTQLTNLNNLANYSLSKK